MRKYLVCAVLGVTSMFAGIAQAQTATYKIDPRHTFVTFEIGHRVGNMDLSTNRGRWDRKDGTVKFDKVARTGQVDITLEMASINTGTEAFDKHLRTADFFDVEKHPTARFTADRFVFNSDQLAQVVGSLTLMGKVHPLTLHAQRFGCVENPMLKREVCGGDFQAVLDRTLFGMEYGIPRGVAKEVRLTLQVEAILQD